jgi:hypothetical protein
VRRTRTLAAGQLTGEAGVASFGLGGWHQSRPEPRVLPLWWSRRDRAALGCTGRRVRGPPKPTTQMSTRLASQVTIPPPLEARLSVAAWSPDWWICEFAGCMSTLHPKHWACLEAHHKMLWSWLGRKDSNLRSPDPESNAARRPAAAVLSHDSCSDPTRAASSHLRFSGESGAYPGRESGAHARNRKSQVLTRRRLSPGIVSGMGHAANQPGRKAV